MHSTIIFPSLSFFHRCILSLHPPFACPSLLPQSFILIVASSSLLPRPCVLVVTAVSLCCSNSYISLHHWSWITDSTVDTTTRSLSSHHHCVTVASSKYSREIFVTEEIFFHSRNTTFIINQGSWMKHPYF